MLVKMLQLKSGALSFRVRNPRAGLTRDLCAYSQAQATQEANRAASNRWPPFWAIAAMLVLGFDEFVAVLYNPLWLLLALILFLFARLCTRWGCDAVHGEACQACNMSR